MRRRRPRIGLENQTPIRGHSLRQGLSQAPSPEVPLPRAAGDGGQVADTGEEEQASLEESRPLFQVIPHDLPRRRVHGKSPPISQAAPSLRSLREAGEKELLVEEALQGADREDLQRDAEAEHEVAVKQHRELKELMQEDEIRMREGMLCKAEIETVMKVAEEVKALEAKLWYENNVKMRKLEADAELEVLQTRTVPLEEIRRDLQGWTEAFRKEVDMLTAGPVSRITKQEYQQLCSQGIPMETLPTKMVATVKPPGRRKGRIVVCGNFASEKASDTSIGGVCAVALRGTIHAAALNDWSLGTVDVKGAFLQTPRRETGKISVVQPPALLVQTGLAEHGEMWRVHHALYGYVESPSDWGHFI